MQEHDVSHNETQEDFTVGGYTFKTKAAADEAKNELNAIKYVSSKTNSKDPKQIYTLYNTMLDKELFKTPVGLDYLKDLQQYLYNNSEIPNDKIRPIPINIELQSMLADKREMTKTRGQLISITKERDKYKDRFYKLIIVNVTLVLAIIAMIIIMATSQLPTIIDYDTKLQDKYSSWQEELQSREAKVKQAELEYNLNESKYK